MKRWVLGAVGFVALLVCVVIWRLGDHDLARHPSETVFVTVSGARIAGTIWLPDDTPIAVVALVHGDGAQDRTSSGGYAPLINAFLDRGFAVASWDKPGVGESEGNWLRQTMPDRTAETRAVLAVLKERFQGTPVGALGFSQAGWVLPGLTRTDVDFLVTIGAAVSWQDQGDYYTAVRLTREGYDPEAITATLAAQEIEDDRLFGPNATPDNRPDGMSPDRWQFIRLNRGADAREALSTLDIPLLALWGAEDLNVDPVRNPEIFRETLGSRPDRTRIPARIVVFPHATHGLLKAPEYNWQLSSDWSRVAVARFLLEGRYAYAPDALNTMFDWIEGMAHLGGR
ncbi:alpha/beta hydrolase [Celeribacter sp. HF31]|uniref:alpha/beta hydrolase n=1 Tax=Celeribacter sp. HF31 TaxID=2721558 RepID=UPI001431759D|nr:alpha/beta hydrolase [Celeribacter sp. HF31]NIY78781.1 alpha/beta hydrolase [Celeribacter sp. HF31]